jgi:lysophospholipase L1-like esterase
MHSSAFFFRLAPAAAVALASHFTLACSEGSGDYYAPSTGLAGSSGEQSAGGSGGVPGTSENPTGVAGEGGGATGSVSLGLEQVRIVAVGDSITQSTCWRALLWQRLSQDFSGRFELVGSHTSDSGCTPAGYDQDNEGYGSALVTEVANSVTDRRTCNPACPTLADLAGRFMQSPADVALMHFGTNDVWNNVSADLIVNAYSAVVGALRASNPNVVILVSQIIPMNVTDATCAGCACPNCVTAIPALNERILAWAAENTTTASPIRVVDQYTGFDATQDNRDGVHPTSTTGSQKMADKWYEALAPLF